MKPLPDEYVSDEFGPVMPGVEEGNTLPRGLAVHPHGARLVTPSVAAKGWGREIIFADGNGYSGKILEFDNKGAKFSLHFHQKKHETWYVLKGRFTLVLANLATAHRETRGLLPGQAFVIPPGCPHRLIAEEDRSSILEVSTSDDPDDNYRIEPGDSQK